MNFFQHKDLGNHLLQLWPKVVKHPVYVPTCFERQALIIRSPLTVHTVSSFLCWCLSAALSCKKMAFGGAAVCIDRFVRCIWQISDILIGLSGVSDTYTWQTNQYRQTRHQKPVSYKTVPQTDINTGNWRLCLQLKDSWWWALDARNM
jgi:hypothetical protein